MTQEEAKKKIAEELVRYDKRYTVASLSILLDKIMDVVDQYCNQQVEEAMGVVDDATIKDYTPNRPCPDKVCHHTVGEHD